MYPPVCWGGGRGAGAAVLQVPGAAGLGTLRQYTSRARAVFPKEAGVLQRVQDSAAHVPPVCGGKRPLLLGGCVGAAAAASNRVTTNCLGKQGSGPGGCPGQKMVTKLLAIMDRDVSRPLHDTGQAEEQETPSTWCPTERHQRPLPCPYIHIYQFRIFIL